MDKEFIDKFKDLLQNPITLVITNPKNHNQINLDILRLVIKGKKPGFYINLNLPQEKILELLKINDIDHAKLHLISCNKGEVNIKNSSFIKSPENLTQLSMILDGMPDFKKYKFLVLDSVNTLLTYNGQNTVIRFLHFLIEKIRSANMGGVIITLSQERNQEIIGEVSQFCDKTIII